MPQQDFSDKIGKSSSPLMNQVIQNHQNKDAQRTMPCETTSTAYNKETVSVPGAGK